MSSPGDTFLSSVQTELSQIEAKVQNLMFHPSAPAGDRPRASPRFRGLTQRPAVALMFDIADEPPRGRERPSNY
jgi:hypothetical protein